MDVVDELLAALTGVLAAPGETGGQRAPARIIHLLHAEACGGLPAGPSRWIPRFSQTTTRSHPISARRSTCLWNFSTYSPDLSSSQQEEVAPAGREDEPA